LKPSKKIIPFFPFTHFLFPIIFTHKNNTKVVSYNFFVMEWYVFFVLGWTFFLYGALWKAQKKKEYKFWKKHISSRKTWTGVFALLSLVLLWGTIENSFSPFVFWVLWGLHCVSFFGYWGWSIKMIRNDFLRIQQAEARRKKRNQ